MIHRLLSKPHLLGTVFTLLLALLLAEFVPHSVSASPSTHIPNGQETLFLVGDSLTVGSKAFGQLQSRVEKLSIWDEVVINAKVGRRSDQSISILKKMPMSTTAIVIALGTNDVISRRESNYPAQVINDVMEAADGLPVLWINTEFSPTGRGDWRFRSRRFNRALRAAQEDWTNLHIADWYSYFTPKGKNRFQSDGVHLSVSAYKLRSQFTASQIQKFGVRIVNATTTTTTTSTTTTSTVLASTTLPETSSSSSTVAPIMSQVTTTTSAAPTTTASTPQP